MKELNNDCCIINLSSKNAWTLWRLNVCIMLRVESFKGTVMQIQKALINDCLRVSKVSWKFLIPTIDNFAVIYPCNLLFS